MSLSFWPTPPHPFMTHPTPPHPFMTHPTPPLHDPPTPPHPTPYMTHPTPSWPTHPTPPHPYMTHPTPSWPTPPHPFMTHPTPTPSWPTHPTPPLHDPPHPFMTHPHPTPPLVHFWAQRSLFSWAASLCLPLGRQLNGYSENNSALQTQWRHLYDIFSVTFKFLHHNHDMLCDLHKITESVTKFWIRIFA